MGKTFTRKQGAPRSELIVEPDPSLTLSMLLAMVLLFTACSDSDNTSSSEDGDWMDGDEQEQETSEQEEENQIETCPFQTALLKNAQALQDRFADATCSDDACLSSPNILVPSSALPRDVNPQEANNNIGVVVHDCRVFLAFRTGPWHFASEETVMYIVSSEDQVAWRYEGEIRLGTDVREPRFLSFKGRLYLYYAILGTEMWEFDPQGTEVIEYIAPGEWSEPHPFLDGNFIPWRIKVIGETAYMTAYTGGENIYDMDGESIYVHWLKSTDGETWQAVVEDHEVVLSGGISETDFVFLDNGDLVAVSRNEAGEPDIGFGSKICRAEASDLGTWSCATDPKKYDSPLLFYHGGRVWLIGRRNVTESGNYDLGREDLSFEDQAMQYQLDYWKSPKRCSLWEVDPQTLSVRYIMDLPSAGDTCFADMVTYQGGLYEIYNYSSPWDTEEDPGWQDGQFAETMIYRLTMELTP